MPIVAFDLDGTLIYLAGEFADTPRYDVVDMFHMFESIDCEMVIWSGGGNDYARRWAQKLGLTATIVRKGQIPVDIAVDDEHVTLGKVNLKV